MNVRMVSNDKAAQRFSKLNLNFRKHINYNSHSIGNVE